MGNGVERPLLSSSKSTVNNRVNHHEDREAQYANIAALCQTNMQNQEKSLQQRENNNAMITVMQNYVAVVGWFKMSSRILIHGPVDGNIITACIFPKH